MVCNSESSVPELPELIVIVIVIVISSSLPPGSTAPPPPNPHLGNVVTITSSTARGNICSTHALRSLSLLYANQPHFPRHDKSFRRGTLPQKSCSPTTCHCYTCQPNSCGSWFGVTAPEFHSAFGSAALQLLHCTHAAYSAPPKPESEPCCDHMPGWQNWTHPVFCQDTLFLPIAMQEALCCNTNLISDWAWGAMRHGPTV